MTSGRGICLHKPRALMKNNLLPSLGDWCGNVPAFWFHFYLSGHLCAPGGLDMEYAMEEMVGLPRGPVSKSKSPGTGSSPLCTCTKMPEFIQQIFTESLQCDWPHVKCWGHKHKEDMASVIVDNTGHGKEPCCKLMTRVKSITKAAGGTIAIM
uniref:Uncharacterized protein n=1 Tax=Molossus molossus TaxID=27622 RepID=A0A7J8JX20_MOLMO|nr:hypothetical protein HJG59_007910 [Molossus molossus]